MRIIFVRHGEPDYERDCLTETGRVQAEAAALRLEREGVSALYASPFGRARETAAAASRRLGLPVTVLPFMHEIGWGGPGIPEDGHPWTLSDRLLDSPEAAERLEHWREDPFFAGNEVTEHLDRVAREFDAFLETLGYRHEGRRFLCGPEPAGTVALFSHGGSGACVLAHLLELPLPFVFSVMPYDFTSLIILNFPDAPGQYVHPRLELFNDAAHIRTQGPVLQREPDRK